MVEDTEYYWEELRKEGAVEPLEDGEGIRMELTAEEGERFTEVSGDSNFAHIHGREPQRTGELTEMLDASAESTSSKIPETHPEYGGELRPLQQGALTPTALAYSPELGFDGLIKSIELEFDSPVYLGIDRETADRTMIEDREHGTSVLAENPWIEESYEPVTVSYSTVGEEGNRGENMRRIALLNALVARAPVEEDESPRDGHIFSGAEVRYPDRELEGEDLTYRELEDEEISETPMGPVKRFEAGSQDDPGFSYTEFYVDTGL
ncbi:MAG: hypothetical protein ABEK01_01155 [Candidatus Nanohaloarchaea archaeon]